MINNTRRNFIFKSTMVAASGVLTACGGGAGSALSGEPAPLGTSTAPTDTQSAATIVMGTPLANATILLSGASVLRAAPYCMGYAFRRGDVPAGQSLSADKGTLQVIPKNVWPDGSLKFALIAGQADVTTSDTTVNLMLIPAPTTKPAQLTTAKLRATEIVASVGCGAFGTVNWTGADWDAPFQTWAQGPVMSSWVYRKPVGADKHLVAWLEVRLWASGAVEVLPWIENGFLQVAAPSNKAETFTFTLGKTQRVSVAIDLKHHQRTPLINGTALSYWLSTDPGVTARHNVAYLQSTELVPTYQAQVAASAPAIQNLPQTFAPLQAGSFNYYLDAMASPGYQEPIGLLPLHDVLYLTSDAKAAYAGVIRNGFSAGRYMLHYRDENTNRPLRFSSYPNLNIGDGQGFKDNGGSTRNQYTPMPTGGNGPVWDVAHSPSVGYLAYLVTGRWYFMEEVQFAATTSYLGNGDNWQLRHESMGLVKPNPGAWQTRSCAWDWRTRVQALCVTPDADTALRSEFIASVEANIEYFHGMYIAKPNNPFGWISPGEGYGTMRVGAPWQQDFVTAAFGYSVSLGLPISTVATDKLAAFFQWKARSAVMRLGTKDGFWYINGAPYNMEISPSDSPDFENGTGPWHTSEKAVYDATYAVAPFWLGKTEGTMAGEIMPGAGAMWGNLMPAIAYAVRHKVPGAMEAYSRILNAGNWPALRDQFNLGPVWAVAPAGFTGPVALPIVAPVEPVAPNPGAPVWLQGKQINQLFEIPNTSGAGGSSVDAYSGLARYKSELIAAASGGHGDSYDNRVVSINLALDAPTWVMRCAPSAVQDVVPNVAYYLDGKPSSRHTYHMNLYVPALNRVMMMGGRFVYGNAVQTYAVDGFNLATNTWDAPGTWPTSAGYSGGSCLDGNGDVWTGDIKFNTSTRTFSVSGLGSFGLRYPFVLDTKRNQMFGLSWGDGEGYGAQVLNAIIQPTTSGTAVQTRITFKDSPAFAQYLADKPAYCGMDYDPLNDYFLMYCGSAGTEGRFYKIVPNSSTVWTMEILTLASGSIMPVTAAGTAGVCGRFKYIPDQKGFALLPRSSSNMLFLRTA